MSIGKVKLEFIGEFPTDHASITCNADELLNRIEINIKKNHGFIGLNRATAIKLSKELKKQIGSLKKDV